MRTPADGATVTGPVIACIKPTPLGEPSVARGQLVVEGLAWGLAPSERRVVAAGKAVAQALDADLVALALGPKQAQAGLREALALGARRAVLVEAGEQRLDAILTAHALAAAAKRIGEPGAVLTGGESADAQQGLLGPMLAELLGLEMLAGVEALRADARGLHVTRATASEEERYVVKPPVLLAVSARYHPSAHATSWGVGEAYALPLQTWTLKDLDLDVEAASELASLARAERPRTEAERFEGDAEEAASQLVRRLRAGGWVR